MVPTTAQPNVVCWVDSDRADDVETRRSVSGGLLTLSGVPVGSWAWTQATPALSSCEAELYAIGSGCAERLGLRSLLTEMGVRRSVKILTDSSSAKSTTERRGPGRVKHIQLRLSAVQYWVQRRLLTVGKVTSDEILSDTFTKPMLVQRHYELGRRNGLRGPPFDAALRV